jgi:hypothetical protein
MVAAGGRIYASDINAMLTNVVTGGFGTAQPGFTLTFARAGTALAGKLVFIRLEITATSAITATAGNITNTTIFQVTDAAYQPSSSVGGIWTADPGTGEFQMLSNGNIILRTADVSTAAAASIRLNLMFMKDN